MSEYLSDYQGDQGFTLLRQTSPFGHQWFLAKGPLR